MQKPSSYRGRTTFRSGSSSRGGGRRGGGGYPRGGGGKKAKGNINIHQVIENTKKQATETVAQPIHEVKNTFDDYGFGDKLAANIKSKGYVVPTPIQDLAIPLILNGKDVVGIANTGTGKSAAFLLPLIEKLLTKERERVLIVVPTRELATQLEAELFSFTKGLRISSVTCVGGMAIGAQISKLKRPHEFVIGTPGRLKDLVNRKVLWLSKYTNVVLDEVDRMLDMGFIVDIKFLIDKLPEERQSLFFSATMKPDVEKVMQQFVHNYEKISVKTHEANQNIEQRIMEVSSAQDKLTKLKELIASQELKKAVVFVKTKHGADKLWTHLHRDNLDVEVIHGDKRQSQRQRVINKFKDNKVSVLIATDVAARGLDISDISHVINFDLPSTADDYVHRIGRTGRAHKKGIAITFVEKFRA